MLVTIINIITCKKGLRESLSPFLQVIKNNIYNLTNKFSKVF
jgi:hypothetical protein